MLSLLKNSKKQKGFTLVELMIVVAIIGILAAIAIPNFRNYQLKAKRGELPTNLKAIKTSEVSYQAEYDVFIACAASPRVDADLDNIKETWTDLGVGFDTMGRSPSGDVYGNYMVSFTLTTLAGTAKSDIDADTALAIYTISDTAEVALGAGLQAVY